jgi:hypothetical protein
MRHRSITQVVLLFLAILLGGLSVACDGGTAQPQELPFESVTQFAVERSGFPPLPELEQPRVFVADNLSEAERFTRWFTSPEAVAPVQAVDFDSAWVVAVFQGFNPYGDLLTTTVKEVRKLPGTVQLIVEIIEPQSSSQTVTHPYHVISIPRQALPEAKGTWVAYRTDGTLLAQTTYP